MALLLEKVLAVMETGPEFLPIHRPPPSAPGLGLLESLVLEPVAVLPSKVLYLTVSLPLGSLKP